MTAATAKAGRTMSYKRFDFTLGALSIKVGGRTRSYEVSRRGSVVRLLKSDATNVYTVRGGMCDCESGRRGRACIHASAVACLSDRGHFGKPV